MGSTPAAALKLSYRQVVSPLILAQICVGSNPTRTILLATHKAEMHCGPRQVFKVSHYLKGGTLLENGYRRLRCEAEMFCDIFGPGFVGLRGIIIETYFPQPNNQDILKSSLMSRVSKQPAWWREGFSCSGKSSDNNRFEISHMRV